MRAACKLCENMQVNRQESGCLMSDAKPQQRLAAYGDCNTLGFQQEQGNGFPEQVARQLGLAVSNFGHTMSTTRELLTYAHDFPPRQYDIVLIQYGLVDSWLTFRHSPYVLYYPNNAWRKFLRKLVKKIKKYARAFRLQERWGAIEVVPLNEYLANIQSVVTSAPNTRFVLIGTSPNLDEPRNPRIKRYNQALAALAEKHGNCLYVDAYDDIYARRHELFFPDGTHLNREGLALLAHRILDKLNG